MKKMLIDLTDDELKKVWDANSELRNDFAKYMYELQMDAQYDDGMLFLDYKSNTYEIVDNYNSFYIQVRRPIAFLETLDFKTLLEYGIVTEDDKAYYENIKRYYENANYYTDAYSMFEEKLEKLAPVIAKKIENYLHGYEQWLSDDELFEEWVMRVRDDEACHDYYIKDDSYVAYCDYTKCYK